MQQASTAALVAPCTCCARCITARVSTHGGSPSTQSRWFLVCYDNHAVSMLDLSSAGLHVLRAVLPLVHEGNKCRATSGCECIASYDPCVLFSTCVWSAWGRGFGAYSVAERPARLYRQHCFAWPSRHDARMCAPGPRRHLIRCVMCEVSWKRSFGVSVWCSECA